MASVSQPPKIFLLERTKYSRCQGSKNMLFPKLHRLRSSELEAKAAAASVRLAGGFAWRCAIRGLPRRMMGMTARSCNTAATSNNPFERTRSGAGSTSCAGGAPFNLYR